MIGLLWLACTGDAIKLEDTDTGSVKESLPESQPDSEPQPSPYAGDWSGTIMGFASFDPNWEANPYCSGEVSVTIAEDGEISGAGDCIILWGPYTGDFFTGSYTGSIGEDGSFAITLTLTDPEEAHGWDPAEIAGTSDGTTISGVGDSQYAPVGLDPIEAKIGLDLIYSEG